MTTRRRPRGAGSLSSRARNSRTGSTRRPLKTSEIAALEIVRDIVELGLKPGSPLPLEAQMLSHYGVSRSSLREAMRLLETQGLVAIRPGPGSGTVVSEACPSNLGRTMTLYFHVAGASYDELLQCWLLTEPQLAGLAAANSDAALRREAMLPFVPDTQEGESQSISTGLNFHDAVAELADNRVLSLVCRAIGHVVSEQVLATTDRHELESYIVEEHAALAQAIIDGDAASAIDLMRSHVAHVGDEFRTCFPERIGQRVVWQ